MEEEVYFHYTANSNLERINRTGYLRPCWFPPSSFKGLTLFTQKGLISGGFSWSQSPEALPIGKCISKCEDDINLLSSTTAYGTIAYLVSYLFTKDKTLSLKTGYGVAFLKSSEEAFC